MSDAPMMVECPCGVVITAPDEDHLVPTVQSHAREVHDMHLDRAQVLDMARPA